MRNKPRATQKRGRNAPKNMCDMQQPNVQPTETWRKAHKKPRATTQKRGEMQQQPNVQPTEHGGKQQQQNSCNNTETGRYATTTNCATDRNMAESKSKHTEVKKNAI